MRKAYIGHMKFVGELYRVHLLSDKIIHFCIQDLFGNPEEPDEEKLACLCTLLTSIGPQLEESATQSTKYAKYMKKYLKELKALSNMPDKLNSRIRFMIKDLLEMRANGWTARRETEKAKTIAEIHEDAARDEAKAAKGGKGGKSSSSNRGSVASQMKKSSSSNSGGAPKADDGWEVPKNARRVATDADGWATVGGGGGGGGGRSAPSRGGNKTPPPQGKSPSGGSMGGFAALNSGNSKAEKEKKKKEKEDKKMEKEKKAAKKAAKAAARSPTASEGATDFSPPASPNKDSPSKASAAGGAMDEKTFKTKAKSIVEEYFSIVDMKEATECVQELASPDHHWCLVTESIDIAFGKKQKECEMVGELFVGLNAAGVLTTEQLEKGLFDLIEFLTDIEIDVPLAGKWLAIVMAKCVISGALTIGMVSRAPEMFLTGGTAAGFAVKLMAAVKNEADDAKLSELVAADSFDVTTLAQNGEDVAALLTAAEISL